MSLKEQLAADLKDAIRQRDERRRNVLRLTLAALHNAEIAARQELDEPAALSVLTKEAKQRRESIEEFRKAGRQDLIEKEEPELAILAAYQPQQLSREEIVQAVRKAIEETDDGWENLYKGAGGGEGVLILGVRKEENRKYQGKTLAQIAEMEGADEIDALMDLVVRDRSRVDTAYFMMSETNVKRQVALPWMSFGSDAQSIAAEGAFLNRSTHPRAYGNFARLLGKYVRDEQALTLAEAIRKLTRLPADNLELDQRGRVEEGYFADLVIFDPETIKDHATFEEPHQYSIGVRDVIVNGQVALRDGEHTGVFPGRALYGPGKG